MQPHSISPTQKKILPDLGEFIHYALSILLMSNDRIWILLARKLSGEAFLTEIDELNRLTSLCPQQQKAVDDVATWWSENPCADSDFLEATYLAHLERMKQKGLHLNEEAQKSQNNLKENLAFKKTATRKFFLKKVLIAGCLFAVLLITWIIFKPSQDSTLALSFAKAAEVSTSNGARSKILLPDGTNVWLNSGSKLTYSKDLNTGLIREVFLTGEAFFDVVKNAKRPFIIHTTKMDVKVLGTQFNVKAYNDDKTIETSLIKGSVEVFLTNNPGRKYLLKPNQKLVLLNEFSDKAAKSRSTAALSKSSLSLIEIRPLTYLQGTETDVESSWTKNILSFEDEAFIEVAKKLERWYDVDFEFKNKNWELQFLNGTFEKETLEQAMRALKYSTGFNYNIEGRKITIF